MDTNRQQNLATTYTENGQKETTNVATTCTEDGHKQTNKSGYKMYRGWTQTDYQNWLQHVQRMDTNRLIIVTKHVQSMDKNRLPKVAKTFTEDGQKQTTNSGYTMYRGWKQTD